MSQRWPTTPRGADPVLVVDASGAPETVTLTRLTPGRVLVVRRSDSTSANAVTITAPAPLTLDGAAGGQTTIGPDSERRFSAVDGGFETLDADISSAIAAERTRQNSTYARQSLPSWAGTARPFDPTLGTYNLRADSVQKWRKARAQAFSGLGQAHVTVGIDSMVYGAAATGVSNPKPTNSVPGRLRRLFNTATGTSAGSGIVPPAVALGLTGNPAYDPRWNFVGTISDHAYGIHNAAAKKFTNNSGANYVEFTDTCTEFWLYTEDQGGSRARVTVDGGAELLIANVTGIDPSLTDPDPETGYQQLVHRIPAGSLGSHTLRVLAPTNNTATVFIIGIEARNAATSGVRVSNFGINGVSSNELVFDTVPTYGMGGLAPYFDMARANLAVLMFPVNDFQAHRSIATFKANVKTAVARQKSSATYRANGDAMLVVAPQPDYANIPADHVLTPAYAEYATALYEVADEDDVPLLDLGWIFKDFTTSNGLAYNADTLHLNDLGSEVAAAAMYRALMA